MNSEPELLAFSANLHITCFTLTDVDKWFKAIEGFFDNIASTIKGPEKVIGHIKGFLQLDNQAYAYFSNVGNLGTDSTAYGLGSSLTGELDFNILVYGEVESKVRYWVEHITSKLSDDLNAKCILEVLEKNQKRV